MKIWFCLLRYLIAIRSIYQWRYDITTGFLGYLVARHEMVAGVSGYLVARYDMVAGVLGYLVASWGQ